MTREPGLYVGDPCPACGGALVRHVAGPEDSPHLIDLAAENPALRVGRCPQCGWSIVGIHGTPSHPEVPDAVAP